MTDGSAKIYLSAPHLSGFELSYIREALDANWVAPLGPHVDAFEREIAAYAGVEDAVAVSSGTAALHLALRLAGVVAGDAVFCSTLTFVASANPVVYMGAEPVFIDSEAESWNMSPQALLTALEEAERERRLPKAVIVVHLYGQSARMAEIGAICEQYRVPVIEDAAESLGSIYGGKASGSMGRFGIYSFNGNKIITTSGGGMLISNDVEALKKARFLAAQAKDPAIHYQHSALGYNYRMSNVLAGVGRAQLNVLNERVEARRAVFERYKQALGAIDGIHFMPELAGARPNRWLTALTIDEQEAGCGAGEVLGALTKANIEARPVWKPMHLQPLFHGARYYAHQSDESVSDRLFHTGLCLPSGSNLTDEQQQRVVHCIRDAIDRANGPVRKRVFSVS